MKKYFLVCLIVFSLLFIVSGSETTNAGFDANTYGIVAETTNIDYFAHPVEPTVFMLLAMGFVGLFCVSRSFIKR